MKARFVGGPCDGLEAEWDLKGRKIEATTTDLGDDGPLGELDMVRLSMDLPAPPKKKPLYRVGYVVFVPAEENI